MMDHLYDRGHTAEEDYKDLTGHEVGLEPIEVVAIALLRIAKALERTELPAFVRALALEADVPTPLSVVDPPPPPTPEQP